MALSHMMQMLAELLGSDVRLLDLPCQVHASEHQLGAVVSDEAVAKEEPLEVHQGSDLAGVGGKG